MKSVWMTTLMLLSKTAEYNLQLLIASSIIRLHQCRTSHCPARVMGVID